MSRIPAGGTDFSTRVYTYDDVEDDTLLQHFALAPEDYEYKIPYIKRALELNPDLKFVSASWSAPPWMKTNDKINGFGTFSGIILQGTETISAAHKNYIFIFLTRTIYRDQCQLC